MPSLGVGYEIGRAVAMGKSVLCLYRPQEGRLLSAMIRGMDNEAGLRVFDYKLEEVDSILDQFLNRKLLQTLQHFLIIVRWTLKFLSNILCNSLYQEIVIIKDGFELRTMKASDYKKIFVLYGKADQEISKI